MLRGVFAIVAVAAGLLLAGCASTKEPPGDVDLFREYARSSDVANGPYATEDMSSGDRLAHFASLGPPEAVLSSVLAAQECADDCHAGGATRAAAKGGTLYQRLVLVKHADGRLELVPLYVVRKSEKDAQLVDSKGNTFRDLDDFLENNETFTSDDLVLLPEKITDVPGEGRIRTVYGHTTVSWLPWLLGGAGGAGGVVVLGAGLVVRRRIAARRTSG
jgi:hypothetical protein